MEGVSWSQLELLDVPGNAPFWTRFDVKCNAHDNLDWRSETIGLDGRTIALRAGQCHSIEALESVLTSEVDRLIATARRRLSPF